MSEAVLDVRNLTVRYGDETAVSGISFRVDAGEIVALVGSSGAGKSTIVNAIMGLLPANASLSGKIAVAATDVVTERWRNVRGRLIGFVPQDPFSWFNPVTHVMRQLQEVAVSKDVDVRGLLHHVGLTDPHVQRAFPHEMSGGMRQRAAIAAAIVNEPPLLIGDEPTSSLDPITRAQIVEVLRRVRAGNRGVLLISHDESLVTSIADRVLHIVDGALVDGTFAEHEMTEARRHEIGERVLTCRGVTKSFGSRAVLRSLDLDVHEKETVAVVGPSGVGKTTLCRLLVGLEMPDAGAVEFDGRPIGALDRLERSRFVQLVFQDSTGALNPRMTVGELVSEGLRVHNVPAALRVRRVSQALEDAGLSSSFFERRSSELSGGERQRVGIARALAMEPRVLVLDEPFVSLDRATRRSVQDRLMALQDERGLAFVLVSHDESTVRELAHRVVELS